MEMTFKIQIIHLWIMSVLPSRLSRDQFPKSKR